MLTEKQFVKTMEQKLIDFYGVNNIKTEVRAEILKAESKNEKPVYTRYIALYVDQIKLDGEWVDFRKPERKAEQEREKNNAKTPFSRRVYPENQMP